MLNSKRGEGVFDRLGVNRLFLKSVYYVNGISAMLSRACLVKTMGPTEKSEMEKVKSAFEVASVSHNVDFWLMSCP